MTWLAASGEALAPDIGGDGVSPSLLPAYQRYSAGRFYRAANLEGWPCASLERFAAEGFILSGLCELLREPIRKYNHRMDAEWWQRRVSVVD